MRSEKVLPKLLGRNGSMDRLIAIGAVLFLASCGPGEGVPGVTLRGHVVLGHEVRSLAPCNEEHELWVAPNSELIEAYETFSREPYEPVFMEVRGELGPAPEEGFGADYPGMFTVRSLRRAAPATEGFGCREDLSDIAFRASGQEPFWHLRVTGDAILFSTPEIAETAFAASTPRQTPEGWVYEAEATGPEQLTVRVVLTRGRCSDTMVGALYSWSASVEVGGEARAGCAWEGDIAPGTASVGPAEEAEIENMGGLTGVEWRLVAIEMGEGDNMTPDALAVPTLIFMDEATPTGGKRVRGSGGCNRFNGEYDAGDDGRLLVSHSPAMTRMACPAAVMRLEQAMMTALVGATSYEIDGGRLSITFGGGTIQFEAGA